MKKALSLLLSLLMVATLFTVAIPTAFAAEGEEAAQMKYISAAEAYGPYKEVITEVNFVGSLAGAPEEGYVWDISDKGDGSIKAWLTEVSETETDGVKTVTSAKLVIGAEGKVKFNKVSSELFEGFRSVTEIKFNNCIDTTDVETMDGMFDNCSALKNIDFAGFETKKVTTFSRMFKNCKSFETIDISALNSENVTDFSRMFEGCANLTALDLSTLRIDKAVTLASMMEGCRNLETVRLDNWYFAPQLEDMTSLFRACNLLTHVYIYDINYHGESVPNQDFMYSGVSTTTLKFHDNNNIGTDAGIWKRFFDDAEGAELVFDAPEHFRIVLDPSGDITLAVGQPITVTAKVLPRPTKYELTWESADPGIAKVKNGTITGVAKGTTTVTVTNTTEVDGEIRVDSAVINVTVNNPKPVDYFEVKYEISEKIAYVNVSSDGEKSFSPVHNGGNYKIIKGTNLVIAPYGDALVYKYYVNGNLIEPEVNDKLNVKVDKNLDIRIEAIEGSGEEALSFFDRIIQWFRDLFDKLFGWMN